jgi:hypothetical protein
MRVSSRTLLTVVMLAIALFGPLAVAFDACLAMCETPCALTVAGVVAPPTLSPPAAISYSMIDGALPLPLAPPTVLKPPPKSALPL